MISCLNVLNVDDTIMNKLPYDVHMDLNVLRLLMLNWIYENRDSAHVITVDNGRPPKVDAKLCQNTL